MLQAKDSALKVGLLNLARRQHIIKIEYTSAPEWHHRARHGFEVLGAQAQGAVPALIDIANQNISRTSGLDAIDALGFIGPSAEQAVSPLLRWAANADSQTRCNAIFALGKIHADPDRVVPALTNTLQDSYAAARIDALIALEHFGPDAKLAVPALVEFLKSDYTTRSSSALKAIDPEAAARAGVK
jgi:HEAT repeat protein